MTERQKLALRYFSQGDNCAQAVFKAYRDVVGISEAQAALVSAGFGGGMGRLRQNCGAYSAAVMLCAAMEGEDGADAEKRVAVYNRVQAVYRRFVEEMGTINCGALLGGRGAEAPKPESRTPAYYASRPCASIIRRACGIIEEQLAEAPPRRLKALVLTTHTGGGHDAAAFAMKDAFEAAGVACRVEDCLAFAGRSFSRVTCGGYVKMVQHTPRLFGALYHIGSGISSARHKSPIYYVNAAYAFRMERLLAEYRPDIIVGTHLFGGQTVTYLKRKGLVHSALGMVMTDYALHPFSEDIEADRLFIGHEAMMTECEARGIPKETLRATGIPVRAACQPCQDKEAAKKALGLKARREVLVVGGSMGAGNLPEVIASILPALGEEDHLTVVCGSNESARADVAARCQDDPRVTVEGRVSPLYDRMAAADVLVTKSGGLTTTEAMNVGTPMLIVNPIEGCETANASFCERMGLARYCRNGDELPAMLSDLLRDDAAREAMIAAQRREINVRAACDIAAEMIALARSRTGARA